MYIIASVLLRDVHDNVHSYEVGAEVHTDDGLTFEVGEPDISAPGGNLKSSRIASEPQNGGVFAAGWSDAVQEALIEAYSALWDEPTGADSLPVTDGEE